MEIAASVILGIIEGLTEFLPVSSTGHLIIANTFFSFSDRSFENMFNIVIQFGAILAVLFYFRKEIFPFGVSHEKRDETFRLWKMIMIGFIPAAAAGVFIDDIMERYLFNPASVSAALICGAFLIFAAEKKSGNRKNQIEKRNKITVKSAFITGLFQCLAMWPGMSRSASAISGALFCGFSRSLAAEFSFLLGIPTIMGASCYKLLKTGFDFTPFKWLLLGTGTALSFITALIVVKFFMSYLKKYSLKPFAVYRIILGIAVLMQQF